MKIAALLLFPLIAFAAESPLLQSREEAQTLFDSAISSADKMVISTVSITATKEAGVQNVTYVPVWETTNASEISPLSQYLRLKFIPPTKQMVDGKEVLVIRDVSYFGYPSFSVTLKKKDDVLLIFYARRSSISCEALKRAAGRVEIDATAYAPFYSHMMEIIKKNSGLPTRPRASGVGDSPE